MKVKRKVSEQRMQPKIVTFEQLLTTLWPFIGQYRWARHELHDLWKQGAPIPNQIVLPGQEHKEKRILLPTQFKAWWEEVNRRHGLDMSAEQVLQRKVDDG